jgi:hypothetical protein
MPRSCEVFLFSVSAFRSTQRGPCRSEELSAALAASGLVGGADAAQGSMWSICGRGRHFFLHKTCRLWHSGRRHDFKVSLGKFASLVRCHDCLIFPLHRELIIPCWLWATCVPHASDPSTIWRQKQKRFYSHRLQIFGTPGCYKLPQYYIVDNFSYNMISFLVAWLF